MGFNGSVSTAVTSVYFDLSLVRSISFWICFSKSSSSSRESLQQHPHHPWLLQHTLLMPISPSSRDSVQILSISTQHEKCEDELRLHKDVAVDPVTIPKRLTEVERRRRINRTYSSLHKKWPDIVQLLTYLLSVSVGRMGKDG